MNATETIETPEKAQLAQIIWLAGTAIVMALAVLMLMASQTPLGLMELTGVAVFATAGMVLTPHVAHAAAVSSYRHHAWRGQRVWASKKAAIIEVNAAGAARLTVVLVSVFAVMALMF